MQKVMRLWHTVRWLRPVQVWGRLWFMLYRPRPDLRPPSTTRKAVAGWTPCFRTASMTGPRSFRFLNVEREFASAADWNRSDWPKLWLYNLHYFDDLVADKADARRGWHRDLIRRWIDENPPARGNGWEPYPTSLRITNWIKWVLTGNEPVEGMLDSLAIQARHLSRRLEYQFLGNHLFVNAKALVYAGSFFEGPQAAKWLQIGLGILDREVQEQILTDGGHFERSPMYHSLILEDILDLITLADTCPKLVSLETRTENWRFASEKMLKWLDAMTHPDQGISFFNDAAFAIAPTPAALREYAMRAGVEFKLKPEVRTGVTALRESGYVRVDAAPWTVLFDVAPVGPDYLPAHAHADTLSLELSHGNQRVLCNSGTSEYGIGRQRDWERSTAAHNTVEIDGENSSEVWSGFRVARRARPFGLEIGEARGLLVRCAHDGYRRLRGRPVHRRAIEAGVEQVKIIDCIAGDGVHRIVGRFGFHPTVVPKQLDSSTWVLELPDGNVLQLKISGADSVVVEKGTFAPEFGLLLERNVLVWHKEARLPVQVDVVIRRRAAD